MDSLDGQDLAYIRAAAFSVWPGDIEEARRIAQQVQAAYAGCFRVYVDKQRQETRPLTNVEMQALCRAAQAEK